MDEEKRYLEAEEAVEDEEQGMFEHFRLDVDGGQEPIRVDKYMSSHLEDTSRHRIQCAIKAGYVFVNGKLAKANVIIRPGDVIRFMMPYRRRGVDIIPQDIPLDIVYEDEDVLVVNKPAGMVVHPGHGNFDGTLVNALAYYLRLPVPDGDERAGILVHRIDKDTSGLLVVAKNDEAQMHLAKQFFDHSIERKYTAVVWGNIREDEGTIDGNIGRDPNDRLRYRVLERFGFVTVVECILETGRTHQIRVHMSHIGHPLFNDERYGGADIRQGTIYAKYKQFIRNCFEICPRQALHARTLGFVHPRTREWIRFDSPLPADMTALIDKWRRYAANMVPDEE